jgi:hypothetical protein
MTLRLFLIAALIASAALAAAAACALGSSSGGGSVLIEPLNTPLSQIIGASAPARGATPTEATSGKPAAPRAYATPAPPTTTGTPGQSLRPATGRWIEVDVTNFVVRLMDGDSVLQTIAPVAVGAQIDTGAYESTQTGIFHVYNKQPGLAYDPPYKTYISDWVGFDPTKANGFHSFLKDKDGNVVNAGTGRISNGCIRTADPAAITAFAVVGMPVWVHA